MACEYLLQLVLRITPIILFVVVHIHPNVVEQGDHGKYDIFVIRQIDDCLEHHYYVSNDAEILTLRVNAHDILLESDKLEEVINNEVCHP